MEVELDGSLGGSTLLGMKLFGNERRDCNYFTSVAHRRVNVGRLLHGNHVGFGFWLHFATRLCYTLAVTRT